MYDIFHPELEEDYYVFGGWHIQGVHLWNQGQEAKIILHKAYSSVSNGINDVVVGGGDQEASAKAEL